MDTLPLGSPLGKILDQFPLFSLLDQMYAQIPLSNISLPIWHSL